MLAKEEKEKIAAEEQFRREERAALDKGARQRRGLPAVLNSPFTLWFLSTVVIGLITFSYTNWKEGRAEARERRRTIERLDLEITSRLISFRLQRSAGLPAEQALLALEVPATSGFPSAALPEYRERGLRALLLELRSLVPPEQKPEISRALAGALELGGTYLRLQKAGRMRIGPLAGPQTLQLWSELNRICKARFDLARWHTPFAEYEQ